MLLILIASYSFASASGSGKGNFSQRQAMGKSLPLPAAEATEYDPCSLLEIVCEDKGESPAIVSPSFNGGTRESPSFLPTLKEICKDHGDYCWKDLMAICQVEGCRSEAIGDQGRSYGYFQIQIKLHKITKECAQDISCSAQWTLQHLEKNKYPLYRTHAIQRHNGSGKQAQLYASKVKQIADKL